MEFTASNNLPLMAQGDLGQYWGVRGLNRFMALVDQSLDGLQGLAFTYDPVTENVDTVKLQTLIPRNGVSDSARPRILRQLSAANQAHTLHLKIPNRPKYYIASILQGSNLIVEMENGNDVKIFRTANNGSALGRFIFHTDGTTIHAVNKKSAPRIVRWNNTDVNVEGGRFVTVQPTDDNVIFLPLNGNVTQNPEIKFLDVSNYKDGFTASIQRGPVARVNATALNPSFGSGSNAAALNVRSVAFVASRAYSRWISLPEVMPGEN